MGMVSIAPFSALHSLSAPKGYHSFAILSSFKHFTAKENSRKLQLLHKTNVLKAYSVRRGSFSFHGAEKHSKLRKFLVESNLTSSSSSQTHMGTWEDPDDGSGSEDEEEAEEHDLGFQSEWEEEEGEEEKGAQAAAAAVDRSTTNKYEEELVKEVEQLLEQEEKAILQKHATPYMKKISTAKWNPVHTLALSGLVTFMDKLLDVDDVDINLVDKDGVTALHTAIIARKEAVISHLLRKGASPHVRDADGATPLHYAVQVGTKRIVKLLIKYKVDVNVADNDGWTPLHIAVQSRNRDIAKILLVNGADKSRRNEDGRTPLDLGFCYGKDFKSYDLTKLLKTVPMDREF